MTTRWGAGGDASVEELESAGTRDPKWLIGRAKKFIDAGAYVRPLIHSLIEHSWTERWLLPFTHAQMIMIESEGITENVRAWRTDVISAVTSALPKDKIMFEAAEPAGKNMFG